MKKIFNKRVMAFFLALTMILSFLPFKTVEAREVGPKVIIYEVYGGGGNLSSTFKYDYIVLKNIGDKPQDLTGWSVQYASATGNKYNNKTELQGQIEPGEFYLIQEAAGNNEAKDLPRTPDVIGKITMSASKFKLALANSTETITDKNSPQVVDFIGAGSANEFLGDNPAQKASNVSSIRRILNEDKTVKNTGDNGEDYESIPHNETVLDYLNEKTEAPNPSDPTDPTDPVTTSLTVKEARDKAVGEEVTTSGIVTFIDGQNATIQDETGGIALRNSTNFDFNLGDKVEVTGSRGTYNGLEQINTTDIKVISQKNELPSPVKMDLASLISNYKDVESQRVLLEGLTLGEYVKGNISLTDDKGNSINIYQSKGEGNKVLTAKAGDIVDVTGVVGIFNSPQIRINSDEDVVVKSTNSPTDPEEPVAGGVNVKEARDTATGKTVTTSGIVTFVDGRNLTIQDDVAGIVVRTKDIPKANLGDKIEATGTRSTYNGLEQLDNSTFKVLSSGNELPSPKVVTLKELVADKMAESLESQRVELKEVNLRQINTSGNTSIYKDNNEMNIYKIPDITKEGISDYDKVNVIAIVSQYNDMQLRVVEAKDVTLVEKGEELVYEEPDFEDPIKPEMEVQIKKDFPEALNINEAMATPFDTEIMVYGVATHSYGGGSALILEDIIDGKVVGYQVYGPTETVQMGDIVLVKGKHINYHSTPEISNVSEMKLIDKTEPVPAQEITAETLKNFSKEFINEYVYIKDITLPKYNGSSTMQFVSPTGNVQTFRAPEYPIGTVQGDKVDIKGSISTFNGTPQIRLGDKTDYIIKEDKLAPFIIVPNLLDARATVDYVFTVGAMDNVDVKSVEFIAKIGEETLAPISMEKDPISGNFKGIIPGDKIQNGKDIELTFKAEDVNGNTTSEHYIGEFIYGESTPSKEPVIVKVDSRPHVLEVSPKTNSEVMDTKSPKIEVDFTNAGDNPKVELVLNDKEPVEMTVSGNKASFTPSNLDDGKVNAKVIVIRKEDGTKSEEFTWSFYIGKATVKAYFGQIHSHTNYSDGSGTPDEAVSYASNVDNLDFFSLTDHSNYFDDAGNLGKIDDANSGKRDPVQSGKSKWQAYKEIIEKYNTEDFLAIYGYEMTWTKTGANYGHINTYNTEGFVSRNDEYYNDKSESKGLVRYYDLLAGLKDKNQNVISQLNHPGTVFGNFDDFGHYSPEYDEVLNLVEVGNGEGPVRGQGYFTSYDQYTLALDKGWHISPSNNQDNHKRKWGDANTTRTVVIADNLDKTSLFDAIRQNRVYATEDNNLFVDFTVNSQMMGSRITNAPGTLKFNVNINDEDSTDIIGTVSVISNGGVVKHKEELNSNVGDLSFEIPNDGTYYYLRIDQADGDIAVTSPVWTAAVERVGIDSVTKSTEVEYLKEETPISTKFVNGSAKDIKLSKIEYYQVVGEKEELIKTVDTGLPTLKSKSTEDFTTGVIPTKTGKVKILVKAYPKDSKEPWTGSIDLNVYDKEAKVTPIAEVQKAPEGQAFTIEGRLTSNASGYDKNTAFFDSAYVQDESGGINIFPISGDFREGQKVRIFGMTSSYQGEHQLNIDKIEIIDENQEKVLPTEMSIGEVPENLGLLVKVSGEVEKVEKKGDIIESIILKDKDNKTIRVFIDGYIGHDKDESKSMEDIVEKNIVEAIGLSSIDSLGNRIRIRNRSDIRVIKEEKPTETESERFVPEVIDETITKGDKVSLLDNIKNLPKNATIEDISNPPIDSNKVGEQTGKVKITFADGSTKAVEIKVVVKDEEKPEEKPDPKPTPRPTPNPTPSTPSTPSPVEKDKIREFEDIYNLYKTNRIYGEDRYKTAVELSKAYYSSSDNVVITSGMEVVDSLTATPLADSLRSPILLARKDKLPQETIDELKRLNSKNITLVGGKSTVSPEVEQELKNLGYNVERVSGKDRYQTAVEVGKRVIEKAGNKHKIVLASGVNLVDALAGNSISAKENIPILLTKVERLENSTREAIKKWDVKEVVIVGGRSSVSSSVEQELKDMGITVTRLKGRDRFETAVEIAKYLYPEAKKIMVANGYNYIDALVAGPVTVHGETPILLLKQNEIPDSVKDYLNNSSVEEIEIVGGSGSISK